MTTKNSLMHQNENNNFFSEKISFVTKKRYSIYSFLSLWVIISLGIILRLNLASRSLLEYDEIWTLQNYVPNDIWDLLNDLKVTNNHPLSTIAIKWTTSLIRPHHLLLLRISSVICGMLTIFLFLYVSNYLLKGLPTLEKNISMVSGISIFLLSPPLIHYQAILRGYSMQSFFVLCLFSSLLIILTKKNIPRHASLFLSVTACLSALLTAFTITTGVIYCCAIALAFVLVDSSFLSQSSKEPFFKYFIRRKYLFIGGLLTGSLVVIWLFSHYNDLQTAKICGDNVWNPLNFIKFIFNTMKENGTLFPLFLTFLLLKISSKNETQNWESNKILFFLWFFILFIFINALFFGAGPVRVYIPMIPPICLIISLQIAICIQKNFKLSVIFVFFIGIYTIIFYNIRMQVEMPPDNRLLFKNALEELPHEIYPVYPTGVGFEMNFNVSHELLIQDTIQRLNTNTHFLAVLPNTRLSGMDQILGEEKFHFLDAKAGKIGQYHLYKLSHWDTHENLYGKPVLAKITNIPASEFSKISNQLKDAGFLYLNPFIMVLLKEFNNDTKGGFFAIEHCSLTNDELKSILEDSKGHLEFSLIH